MEVSSLAGGNKFEYTAQAASSIVNGEVKLTIGEDSFTATGLFDAVKIPFAEIVSLLLADYAVSIKTEDDMYIFSRLGSWCQPFYDALCDAYNKAVLRALFVKGGPILTAKGDCYFTENGIAGRGPAPVHIYENSVVSLPPDLSARRVPLCFVSGMDRGGYELTLKLNTGESYIYAKLGYDTAPFAAAVEKQIRELREKTLAAVKALDPSLSAAQASQIAKLMPEGTAACVERLADISPSFVETIEKKLFGTRAAWSYEAFKELCGRTKIWIGFKKNDADTDGAAGLPDNPGTLIDALTDGGEAEMHLSDPYLLWLTAPSPDGQYAAVEFAVADTATFIYRTGGDFESFACRLNRALEAIDFRREAIWMSDAELLKPENSDYRMAARRTEALQFVRKSFAGRVIHSSPEAWKRKLTKLWSTPAGGTTETTYAGTGEKFCGKCGASLSTGMKFCGACGAIIS